MKCITVSHLTDVTFSKARRGVGGYQQIIVPGGSALRSNPITILYTIFHEKGTPFVYLLLTNGTPFTCLV